MGLQIGLVQNPVHSISLPSCSLGQGSYAPVGLSSSLLGASCFNHSQTVSVGILPGFTRAWPILQPSQTLTDETMTPHAYASPARPCFLTDDLIRFLGRGRQHQTGALHLSMRSPSR